MLNRVALLAPALLAAGCDLTVRETPIENPQTAILVAQTRRAQILLELEHLERLARRTVTIDGRAVVQSHINRLRFELEQLNAIIQ